VRVAETPARSTERSWHQDLHRRYYPRVERAEPASLAAARCGEAGRELFQRRFLRTGARSIRALLLPLPPQRLMNIYRGSLRGEEKDI